MNEIEKETDSSARHFFEFLTVYIDLINIQIKDIDVYEDLKNCLKDDKYFNNVIFDVVQKEHDLMSEIITETPDREELHRVMLVEMFPTVEQKYIQKETKDII